MKIPLSVLSLLFCAQLLLPPVNAEGERGYFGMDEEYNRSLAETDSPRRAAAAPEKRVPSHKLSERYQLSEEYKNNDDCEEDQPDDRRHGHTPADMAQCYETTTNAWQDQVYYEAQQRAEKIPGILRAPITKYPYTPDAPFYGTTTCYKGNTAQWLEGSSAPLGASLPQTQNGLNALNGGYTGPAGSFTMSGGFKGAGGGSRLYPSLPPTATSVQVDLNVVQ